MKISERNKFFIKTATAISMLLAISVAHVSAAPTDGTITSGNGTISVDGLNTNINQVTRRLDIDWRSFSTEANEAINFNQPDINAIAINRVVGNVPSELRGALNANGKVVIMNDAGITFHGGSQTRVGSLLATTANNLECTPDGCFHFTGKGEGKIVNDGRIKLTSDNGFVALIAPEVINNAPIFGTQGSRMDLASSNDFYLDLRGDNLIKYKVTNEDLRNLGVTINHGSNNFSYANVTTSILSTLATNSINLNGVLDTNFADNGGFVNVISNGDTNIRGVLNAESNGTEGKNGGKIVVSSIGGTTNIYDGALLTANANGGNAGIIEVSGTNLNISNKAVFAVSGINNGTVSIGGSVVNYDDFNKDANHGGGNKDGVICDSSSTSSTSSSGESSSTSSTSSSGDGSSTSSTSSTSSSGDTSSSTSSTSSSGESSSTSSTSSSGGPVDSTNFNRRIETPSFKTAELGDLAPAAGSYCDLVNSDGSTLCKPVSPKSMRFCVDNCDFDSKNSQKAPKKPIKSAEKAPAKKQKYYK